MQVERCSACVLGHSAHVELIAPLRHSRDRIHVADEEVTLALNPSCVTHQALIRSFEPKFVGLQKSNRLLRDNPTLHNKLELAYLPVVFV